MNNDQPTKGMLIFEGNPSNKKLWFMTNNNLKFLFCYDSGKSFYFDQWNEWNRDWYDFIRIYKNGQKKD